MPGNTDETPPADTAPVVASPAVGAFVVVEKLPAPPKDDVVVAFVTVVPLPPHATRQSVQIPTTTAGKHRADRISARCYGTSNTRNVAPAEPAAVHVCRNDAIRGCPRTPALGGSRSWRSSRGASRRSCMRCTGHSGHGEQLSFAGDAVRRVGGCLAIRLSGANCAGAAVEETSRRVGSDRA